MDLLCKLFFLVGDKFLQHALTKFDKDKYWGSLAQSLPTRFKTHEPVAIP